MNGSILIVRPDQRMAIAEMRSGLFRGAAAGGQEPQTGRTVMAGKFEVFIDAEAHFRFRLRAPDGTELAVSAAFEDKSAVVAGIAAVRECAGMGLVTDLSPAGSPVSAPTGVPPAPVSPAPVPPNCEPLRMPPANFRTHVPARRAAQAPHLTGAA
jgi:uncharacterized protein YegP (UPF0339 family)